MIRFGIWFLALVSWELPNPHLNPICRSKKPTCPQLTFNKIINIILPYSFCPNNLSLVNILYKLISEIECNPKCHLLAISKRYTLLKLFFAYLFEISTYGSDSQFTEVNSIKQSYNYLHSSSSPVKLWRVLFSSFLLLYSLHSVEKWQDLFLGIIKNIIKNCTQRRLTRITLFYPTVYWASCHIFIGTLTFAWNILIFCQTL